MVRLQVYILEHLPDLRRRPSSRHHLFLIDVRELFPDRPETLHRDELRLPVIASQSPDPDVIRVCHLFDDEQPFEFRRQLVPGVSSQVRIMQLRCLLFEIWAVSPLCRIAFSP